MRRRNQSGSAIIEACPQSSERDRAGDTGRDVAADPDRIALLRDMDAARAAKHGALGGDVARLGEARADQPLRKAGIEAAGDGILGVPRGKRANLELRLVAVL